jgi:hypothetical protein
MPRAKPETKPEEAEVIADLEQDAAQRPSAPVDTDSNEVPSADANGDSDDERADENQAIPDPA